MRVRSSRSSVPRARRVGAVVVTAALTATFAPLGASPARAVEVPAGDYQQAYEIQTNGKNGLITLGDQYSATTAQGGAQTSHLLKINIPCSWPTGTPIYVDLFSPEIDNIAPYNSTYDEVDGTPDNTQFALANPGGTQIATQSYAPISNSTDLWSRFATLAAPVACGTYSITTTTSDNDQNGWRLRVGTDNDSNPANTPPANYDNPDGLTGTDDEITIGLQQISYQHDLGDGSPATAKCLTLFEYVDPGKPSVTFNNFDLDSPGSDITGSTVNSSVRYYAPGAAFDPSGQTGGIVGTRSGNGVWNNGGTASARGGDTVTNPAPGWWRIVTCAANHNQWIQEGQAGVPAYLTQPPTPNVVLTKTDGQTVLDLGQRTTYTVTLANTATGSTAGAADNIVVKDTLPAGMTPVSCTIPGAVAGETCTLAGQTYTATLKKSLAAGSTRSLTVVADVSTSTATTSWTNSATATYTDSIGNAFVPVTATDTDTKASADVSVTKTHSGSFTVGATGTYTLTATNAAGAANRARSVTIVDTLPAGLTYAGATGTNWTCTSAPPKVTCVYGLDLNPGASAALTLSVNVAAAAAPSVTNTATVSTATAETSTANNTASDATTVGGASIGDKVFTDTNGNGVQDAGEAGVSGATVRLLASDGVTVLKTTTTGAGGLYSFTGLAAGTYVVQFVAPTGTVFTNPDAGSDDSLDSDANRTSGNSPPVTVTTGQAVTNVDAGVVAPASVGDLVYNDLDASGAQNGSEPGLAGLTVTLARGGTTVATTTTSATGAYSFTGLVPGTYTVSVATPASFTSTGPKTSPATVTLAAGQNDTAEDFGFVQSNASIGDTVYVDANGNGVQDGGEAAYPAGATVTLRKNGTVVATTTTNASGQYSFTGLTAGAYTVTLSVPTNYSATTTNPVPVTLTAGQSVTTADFGIRQTNATIGDTVYVDTNANGVQDGGETGYTGAATVTLFQSDGTTQVGSPVTTSGGTYTFTGLPAGTYVVKLTVPTGYAATTSTSLTRTVAAGGSDLTADFGIQQAAGSIGDTVFNDLNGNGVQDAGEPGLSGRVVTLTKGGTSVTATTDASGHYLFSGLVAGSYTVSVGTPNTFSPTAVTSPLPVNLAANQAYATADFGFWQTNGSIGDLVWNDLNGNGAFDAGEPGLDGVAVQLSRNGVPYRTTTTAGGGLYSFGSLPAGSYVVTITPPTGFGTTTTYPVAVTLTVGQSVTTADVGLIRNDGSIGDTVFRDLDGDGTQSGAGETGLAGLTVTLTKGGTTVGTTTTDGSGRYSFTGLTAGTYAITVTGAPTGFTPTSPLPRTVTLTAGQADPDEDIGFRETDGVIGDHVFNDLNGNGVQDAGEPGLSGRVVTLTPAASTNWPTTTATTDANGLYSFTGLPAGTYTVSVPTPGGGFQPTAKTSPQTVTIAAGGTDNTVDFGFQQRSSVIGDTVFLDTNGNKVQDAGESGYPAGATVTLSQAGQPDRTTTTSGTGTYSFTGLAAGTYTVTLTVPSGYSPTTTDPQTVTIAAGTTNNNVDFGVRRTDGSLSGFVYKDADGSTTKGAGEGGVGTGLTVTLRDNGVVVTTTTADPTTGAYSFTGLPSSTTYTVSVPVPTGYVATTADPTGNQAVTAGGAATTDVNIGLRPKSASVTGTVFAEKGAPNGTLDATESGLSGVTVELLQNGTVIATTTSATDGSYAFPGLFDGTYDVRYTAPTGYVTTTPSTTPAPPGTTQTVTGIGTPHAPVNLGLALAAGSIGDTVYADQNGNGTQDAGESGLASVTVRLVYAGANGTFGDGDDTTTTASTDANGHYVFSGLTDGDYQVDVPTGPAGATLTNPASPAPATFSAGAFTVTLGGGTTSYQGADFGYLFPQWVIGDTVYSDPDSDGAQQVGEPGLAAQTVQLVLAGPDGLFGTADDTTSTTATDANGRYSFTGTTLGAYRVTVFPASGLYATTPASVTGTLTSTSQVVSDADFGLAAFASIGDLVFDDADGSTGQNGAEGGLAGATVTVTGGPDSVTLTATTGASGAYAVGGLKAGTYTVSVAYPSGYVGTTVSSYTTTVSAGQSVTTDDFGAQQRAASVTGTVYAETDGTAGQTGTDPGLSSVTVTLKSGGTTVATTTTGANGGYSFTGLPAGSYTVTATTPAGYTAVDPTPVPVTLTGSSTATASFGEVQTNASLGDTVYSDTNKNGSQDAGELGVNGVTVTLKQGATTVATTTTATNGANAGRYLFSGLPAGTYSVVITVPSGYTTTTPSTQALTLAAGQATRVIDFGIVPLGITGTVFRDTDNDGPTAGETGVAGATVTLSDGTGTLATTTTAADGTYAFNGYPAGPYTVTVTVPAGYAAHDGVTTRTATITSSNGVTGVDFELAPRSSSIGDLVYSDLNGNGSFDTGEPGLPGGTVVVSQGGTTVATVTSAADGSYSVPNLPAGTYTVTFTAPTGYTGTTPSPKTVTLPAATAVTDADFGAQQTNASIGDRVFLDANGNGTQDAGEVGYPGGTVTLYEADGVTQVAQATAGPAAGGNPDGFYTFSGLAAGTYVVKLTTVPTGYAVTSTNPRTVVLAAGQVYRIGDFGLVATPGAISGNAFADNDGSGTRTAGDADKSGVTVTLSQTGKPDVTTTTDANGNYSFPSLPLGSYTVTVTVPSGFAATSATATTVTLTGPSPTSTGNDFALAPATSSIGDLVFDDPNANGTRDGGEAGLDGIVVTLTRGGTTVGTTTTSGGGAYSFTGLVPGSYTVTATVPTGSVATTTNPVVRTIGGTPATVTDADFGIQKVSSSIAGTAFDDPDANKAQDPGELGVGGLTVSLSGGPTSKPATTTAADGSYSFTGLAAGTYTVTFTVPAGSTATTPDPVTVTVPTTTDVTGVDLGLRTTSAAVTGNAFSDTNGNGTDDGTVDPALVVTVTLSQNGTVVATQQSTGGAYSFTGLPAGTYTVSATAPAGTLASTPVSGTVTLTTTTAAGPDFGFTPVDASLAGQVFVDTDSSGTRGAGETGYAGGATVTLTQGAATVGTTTTAGDGSYSFTGLAAGTYTVTLTTPSGYTATPPVTVSQPVGPSAAVTGVDFGVLPTSALVSGTVFDDLDKSGAQNGAEPGRSGVTVTLSQTGQPDRTTTTDANGDYEFAGLPAGSYTVKVTAPSGVTTTSPVTVAQALTAGQQVTTVDFGLGVGTIGDTVFADGNGNGTQDAGEAGVPNVSVTLRQGATVLGSVLTDANGRYSFGDLDAGTYTVTISVPSGQVATTANPSPVVLAAGATDNGADFGLRTPADNPPAYTSAASNTAQTVAVGVALTPLQATDPDSDPLAYALTSGTLPPGVTGINPNGSFAGTPTTPGTYGPITVTVDDGRGGTATTTLTITVKAAGQPPVAKDDAITTPGGAPITFDPRANDTDPAGEAITITSKTNPAHGTLTCSTTSCTYTPTAGYVGPDQLTYTITNTDGLSSTATVDVVVTNTPPAFTSSGDNTAQTVPLGGSVKPVSATDANGDPLTYTVTGGSLPPGVTLNPNGTFSGTPTASGTTTATVTVDDGKGGTDTTTLVVTVPANGAPVFSPATGNTSQTIAVGAKPVPVTATDPNGDPLTYTLTSGSLPGVTLNPDGSFSGAATTPGSYPLTITVADGHGGTATTTLTVTVTPPADRAPVAADDTATTPAGTAVSTTVLANDTDPDTGDTLTVLSHTDPAHGTVTCDNTITPVTHPAPTCTYTPAAGYTGTDAYDYVVSDGRGLTDTGTVTVTVTAAPNSAPTFGGTTPQTVTTGSLPGPLTFNDPEGDAVTVTVPDPTQLPPGVTGITSGGTWTGPGATTPGTYTVTVTATDSKGASTSTPVTITVVAPTAGNTAPTAVADTATTPTDTAVTTSVLANDTDPDAGDTLAVLSHTDPAHGTVSCTTTACTYTPDTGFAGTDTYTYVVSDGHGGTATATVTVTVQNAPPAFDGSAANTAQTVPAGVTPAPLSATDPNGDPLTYAVTSGTLPPGVTLQPDGTFSGSASTPGSYGPVVVTVTDGKGGSDTTTLTVTVSTVNTPPTAADDSLSTSAGTAKAVSVLGNDSDPNGDTLTVSSFSQPAHGTVTCTAAGSCTYTPAAGYTGPDSFTYTVSDGHGGTATATVSVTVTAANAPPVANPDSATTLEDTAVSVSVLGNDSDPDSDALTFGTATQPAHGTVTCTAGGVCTYTPSANFQGTDAFTYTVSDGKGHTSTGTVTITVTSVNDAPTPADDASSTAAGTPVTIGVLGNDTDPDAGDTLTITGTSTPAHGTAVCSGSSCTYTPAAGFSGTDTFTYTVSDGHGGTATATVTVTVTATAVNGPPVANPDNGATTAGTPVVIGVLGNDTDPDADSLTVTGTSTPAHGTVTCTAAGSCTYTPATGFTGTDTFTYTVSDGHGHTATGTVTVTVGAAGPNVAPVVKNDSATTTAGLPVTVGVLANDTDADKDPLTVTGTSTPAHGTVTCTTAGACTYTPDAGFTGTDTFTYTVSDGHGHSVDGTVTVTVGPAATNGPPVAKPDTAKTAPGTAVVIPVTGNDSDPDGDPLSVVSSSDPAHGTATCTAAGTCTYTPDAGFTGTDTFTYTVSDGHGHTATTTVTVTVAAPATNQPPTPQPDTVTVLAGTATGVPVLDNDTDPDGDPLTIVGHSDPARGTVVCNASTCTYTSDPAYSGTDTYTYTVSDGHGHTRTTTVTVTVDGTTTGNGGAGGGAGAGNGGGSGGSGNGGGSGGAGNGGGGLPFTGGNITQQLAWALALLAAGLLMLLVGRTPRRD